MNCVLVTGGAGFIGSNFVRTLLREENLRVINLDKLTYAGNLESLGDVLDHPNHIFVRGDIGDRRLVSQLLDQYQPQTIAHLAAESHVDRSIDHPGDFIHTNIVGTFELLEAARGYWTRLDAGEQNRFRFLYVSTDEVFGSLGPTGFFSEQSPITPNSPYSASKASANHLVWAYYHTYGLPAMITNCSNNYGPYQFPEKLIPLMIHNALNRKPLPIYGDGQNIRDWLYVQDHCNALLQVLKAGQSGEMYNIGGNSERTNLQVVEQICDLLDEMVPENDGASYRRLITFVRDRPGHDRRYAINATKIQQELGWTARETFESGLRRTVRWYVDNREWCRHVLDGSYRDQADGIPESEANQ